MIVQNMNLEFDAFFPGNPRRNGRSYIMTDNNQDNLQKYIAKQNRLIQFQSIVQTLILAVLLVSIAAAAMAYVRMQSTVSLMEEKINQVDIAALNESIVSLNKASENLEALDTEQINEMTSALNKAAENLESVSSSFSGWFS